MIARELQSQLAAIEADAALYEPASFARRAAALDHIEVHVSDRIEGLLRAPDAPEGLAELRQDAKRVRRRLEAADDALFGRLRADIRAGRRSGAALARLIDGSVGRDSPGRRRNDEVGYDTLDLFVNGLLRVREVPAETRASEPEMVAYQQTPARIIFELVERAQLADGDVLFDLGSGLGHVPILVNLLSGAAARGIEFEPAYCDAARACAADLNLSRVVFVNADARAADYAEGTVFFLYTPFTGGMLDDVLAKLRAAAHTRPIRICTYGPCTSHVARQPWLRSDDDSGDPAFRLAIFSS